MARRNELCCATKTSWFWKRTLRKTYVQGCGRVHRNVEKNKLLTSMMNLNSGAI